MSLILISLVIAVDRREKMSKKVEIEGKSYEIPDEANYIAMDADGSYWWFYDRPEAGDEGYWEAGFESYGEIIKATEKWKDSLRKVGDV